MRGLSQIWDAKQPSRYQSRQSWSPDRILHCSMMKCHVYAYVLCHVKDPASAIVTMPTCSYVICQPVPGATFCLKVCLRLHVANLLSSTAFDIWQLLKQQAFAAIDCNMSSTLCTSSAAFACNFLFHTLSHGMQNCTAVAATQDCMHQTQLKDMCWTSESLTD